MDASSKYSSNFPISQELFLHNLKYNQSLNIVNIKNEANNRFQATNTKKTIGLSLDNTCFMDGWVKIKVLTSVHQLVSKLLLED